MRRLNWPLWTGLALSVVAFISYFTFFVRFPVTRDVPWANFVLFAIAILLLVVGTRRAWLAGRRFRGLAIGILGLVVFVFFALVVTVGTKMLPPAQGAPRVGQKAPDFTLLDTSGKQVALSQLLASSPRGVMLVFYRGYW
ncbi:MAG TPA: hypothetical protein VF980_00685 [Thermoanaerobaculia bacterium]